MFGMSDPTQTLLQLENYVKDGRLEMSEVMATQFTDMFLSNKKRTQSEQILLIRGLQILCDVLLIRGKNKLAVASAKTLLRERKRLPKECDQSSLGPYYTDFNRHASSLIAVGKKRAARKAFVKINKMSGGCLYSSLEAIVAYPSDAKLCRIFVDCVSNSGPVIRSGEQFCLIPEGLRSVDAQEVVNGLQTILPVIGEVGQNEIDRIQNQIEAIKNGEMAANARLQSALDSLAPKHSYYEYS